MSVHSNSGFSGGSGRGIGRGMGRGMGIGRGMGRGGGFGRGRMNRDYSYGEQPLEQNYPTYNDNPIAAKPDINMLKRQAKLLEEQLRDIQNKIEELENQPESGSASTTEKVGQLKAFVIESRCIGCAICANVCPTGAITMDDIALVDQSKCIGCGDCVQRCPKQAIVLRPVQEDNADSGEKHG